MSHVATFLTSTQYTILQQGKHAENCSVWDTLWHALQCTETNMAGLIAQAHICCEPEGTGAAGQGGPGGAAAEVV